VGSYARGEIGLSLYDLERDPAERINVAVEHRDVVQRLLMCIERARRELGDAITDSQGDSVRPPGMVDEPWAKQVEGGY
jgi:arylsulfatase